MLLLHLMNISVSNELSDICAEWDRIMIPLCKNIFSTGAEVAEMQSTLLDSSPVNYRNLFHSQTVDTENSTAVISSLLMKFTTNKIEERA